MPSLVPDIIYRPSANLEEAVAIGSIADAATVALDSTPSKIKSVELRLRELTILDFKEGLFDDKAEVYLVTIVADGLAANPITTTLQCFEGISRKQTLAIGPAGLSFYRSPDGAIPRFIDYRILVMESDEDVRKTGAILYEIQQDRTFKTVKDNLIALAAASNPIAAVAAPAIDLALDVVARTLKAKKDDQLLYAAGSFNANRDRFGSVRPVHHGTPNVRLSFESLLEWHDGA